MATRKSEVDVIGDWGGKDGGVMCLYRGIMV